MVEVFLFNGERGLWYDGRYGWYENLESVPHFRIESESSESNLEASQVPKILRILFFMCPGTAAQTRR